MRSKGSTTVGSQNTGSMAGPDRPQIPESTVPLANNGTNNNTNYVGEPAYREHVSGPLRYETQPAHSSFYPAPSEQIGTAHQAAIPGLSQIQANKIEQRAAPYPYYSPGYSYPPQAYPAQGRGYKPWRYPAPPYQIGYNGNDSQTGYFQPAASSIPYGYNYNYNYPYQARWQAPLKRDGYQFVIAIIATICSCLVVLSGLISGLITFITFLMNNGDLHTSQQSGGDIFSGTTLFAALTIAGLVGGSFCLYHSIRALTKARSINFRLPRFPIFIILYIVLLGVGFSVRGKPINSSNTLLTMLYVGLTGLLPALTIASLAVRRLHIPGSKHWPTTWRRFTIALVSGSTVAIALALLLEEILSLITATGLQVVDMNLNDPNAPMPNDPKAILYLFLTTAVIAPLVEEMCKPLAVVSLIGRINSAAEAFILGLGCGIGFDLIETTGYISSGYTNWVDIALERSTTGLLHGFGAGMVALGWYFLTHPGSLKKNRILIGICCGGYAIAQHAIWNGSLALELIPGPVGNFFNNGQITIGNYPLQSDLLIYLTLSVFILWFLFFITKRLRNQDIRREQENENKPAEPVPAVTHYPNNNGVQAWSSGYPYSPR